MKSGFYPFALAALGYCTMATNAVVAQNASNLLGGANPGANPSRSTVIRDDSASVQCIHDLPIAAQTDGLILELLADEGVSVKKGERLIVIDDRVAQAEVSVAFKEYEAAKRQADETANVEFAKKSSEVATAEFDMEAELFKKFATTQTQVRRKKLEAEKGILGMRVSEVEHKKEGLAAEVAKEKHHAAEVRLQLHQAVAPFDGVIVRRVKDQGEWTRAGEPVLQLMHMNEMKVQALVPIKGISIISLQGALMKIEVPVNDGQAVTIDARIDFVSPVVENGRVRVSTRVENQAVGGIWVLRQGMPATVEITPNL